MPDDIPAPSDRDPDVIRVPVNLGPRSYEVRVVSGNPDGFSLFAREALEKTWAGKSCRAALVVSDENVQHIMPAFTGALLDVAIEPVVACLPPGEASKSLDRACDLYDELIHMKADRHTVVVAIGGGVVGDLAGFVAATYARGVPLLMIPTTLLAQVDSSVGGKVGVNHPRAKNIIGAFHQPSGVWIDTNTLESLPEREVRNGLAEVVKYGVILDAPFFERLEAQTERIQARAPQAIREIVARCCAIKADVVTRDEREETGLRAVLNFGHTIGHAIEAVAGYDGPFHHGEAVAVGMVAEARLAERIGWFSGADADRLTTLLTAFGLPTRAAGLDTQALIEAMSRDKKNRKGKVRFVLPRSLGTVELTDLPSESDIRAVLERL
ncbi:MAG: 3-dehydroquinate synthase [Isosphaeraceae bacterium]